MTGHRNFVTGLAVQQDSKLISGSVDKTFKLWEYYEYVFQTDLIGHNDSVDDLKFLKKGNLASYSKDKSIRIWNMNSITNYEHRNVLALNLLQNGNLVSSSEDKTLKVWITDLFFNIYIIKGYYSKNDEQNLLTCEIDINSEAIIILV